MRIACVPGRATPPRSGGAGSTALLSATFEALLRQHAHPDPALGSCSDADAAIFVVADCVPGPVVVGSERTPCRCGVTWLGGGRIDLPPKHSRRSAGTTVPAVSIPVPVGRHSNADAIRTLSSLELRWTPVPVAIYSPCPLVASRHSSVALWYSGRVGSSLTLCESRAVNRAWWQCGSAKPRSLRRHGCTQSLNAT